MANGQPLFDQVNLVARDLDATLTFYRRLGVDLDDARVWRTASGAHHAEVRMPSGVSLELDSEAMAHHYDAGRRAAGAAGQRAVIGFKLSTREAVDARYAALTAAGYVGRQPPCDAFWGARYAIVEDPDGTPVGLMSPVDPTRRGAPPSL